MRRTKFVALALAAVSIFGVTGTVAWLTSEKAVTNTFEVAKVGGSVEENFDNQIKTDVKIKVNPADHASNPDNIPVYIRVALVPTWMDGDKATALKTKDTYDLVLKPNTKWQKNGEYYYYTEPVAPDNVTDILISSCKPKSDLDSIYQGKQFKLDIIAQFVQASPSTAVTELWDVNPSEL